MHIVYAVGYLVAGALSLWGIYEIYARVNAWFNRKLCEMQDELDAIERESEDV